MTSKEWTIVDTESETFVESLSITAADAGRDIDDVKVTKSTLRGGPSDGVEVILVETGEIGYSVLPTRGMSLWRARRGDFRFGWDSPVPGPIHPKFVPLTEPGGLGWLDGFDELLVRCGLESNGAPDFDDDGRLSMPLHGRIGNRPARKVTVSIDKDTGQVTVTGIVEECRFHFLKLRLTARITTRPDSNAIVVEDEVKNLSASDAEMQLLYHVNFGHPLLDSGSRFVAPLEKVVPRNEHAASGIDGWEHYHAPTAGYEEQVYFMKLLSDADGKSTAMLKNAHATHGASLDVNVRQLPWFTVWKNTTALEDGYVTGLEPGTNFPNPRSFEGSHGRTVSIPGGQSVSFRIGLNLLANAGEINAVEDRIQTLQQTRATEIVSTPSPDWCA